MLLDAIRRMLRTPGHWWRGWRRCPGKHGCWIKPEAGGVCCAEDTC